MLEVDPTKRTSAADALKHPYFSEEVIEEKMDLLNAKISEASALSTMSSPNSQETS
jgi:serine/threonine protein kinase